MPRRVPTHRPCGQIVPGPGRHREYDRHARDAQAKVFYDSSRWRKVRLLKLRTDPLCERCKAMGFVVPASHVHHRVERSVAPELALVEDNLESLCASCHSRHHASAPGDTPGTQGGGIAADALAPPTAAGHARVF